MLSPIIHCYWYICNVFLILMCLTPFGYFSWFISSFLLQERSSLYILVLLVCVIMILQHMTWHRCCAARVPLKSHTAAADFTDQQSFLPEGEKENSHLQWLVWNEWYLCYSGLRLKSTADDFFCASKRSLSVLSKHWHFQFYSLIYIFLFWLAKNQLPSLTWN